MKNSIKTHLRHITPITPTPKPNHALRLLHTSDWHLGKLLYHEPRYHEFEEFLNWLLDVLQAWQVDILLIAGDIFDTTTPSNRAERLYHQFLAQVYKQNIPNTIIIAGNHDSPSSLNKTKDVLGVLGTHVISTPSDNIDDNVLILKDKNKNPIAIVITAPYLRDRDVRSSVANESGQDKAKNLLDGIKAYYHRLSTHAKEQQNSLMASHGKLPIIATGHLFATGCHVSASDDGMRDLHVGTLGEVSADIFAPYLDYVALGHIHAPQIVGGREHIRYCGSPIAMGFGEIGRTKQVLMVDFLPEQSPQIHSLPVPIFQSLVHIRGDMPFIETSLNDLKAKAQNNHPIWLQVEYIGQELIANLNDRLNEIIQDSPLVILKIKNKPISQNSLRQKNSKETLNTLNEIDVFEQRLALENLTNEETTNLMSAYKTLLKQLQENDEL